MFLGDKTWASRVATPSAWIQILPEESECSTTKGVVSRDNLRFKAV